MAHAYYDSTRRIITSHARVYYHAVLGKTTQQHTPCLYVNSQRYNEYK